MTLAGFGFVLRSPDDRFEWAPSDVQIVSQGAGRSRRLPQRTTDRSRRPRLMAVKVTLTLSPAQAEALGKILAAAPKQTKTVDALTAKLKDAIAASTAS